MTDTKEIAVAQKAIAGTIEYEVVVQKWEESESGWGTRPDGYSLHMTEVDREAYVTEYWARMPDEIPDEYSRTKGSPYTAFVSAEDYDKIKTSKNGTRSFDNNYPGSGGTDGWVKPSAEIRGANLDRLTRS